LWLLDRRKHSDKSGKKQATVGLTDSVASQKYVEKLEPLIHLPAGKRESARMGFKKNTF
jgi:hypothetical protein